MLSVILLIMATVFLIPKISFALQGACNIVTFPKVVTYSPGWYGDPGVYSSTEEVAPCGTLSVYVDSGGFGRPPYSLSVSGNGFYFNTDSGPAYEVTVKLDLEIVTLEADCNSCGAAEITVTDSGGISTAGYVRSTNGTWRYDATLCSSKSPDYVCVGPAVGKYQYVVGYSGNPSAANCGQPCGAYYTANAAAMGLTPAGCVRCAHPAGKYYFTQTGCSDCTGSCGEVCWRIKIGDISRYIWGCQ